MRINVAVSGKFHFHNYVRFLEEAGVLGRFYYAHRMSTGPRELGIPGERLVNVWMKEYLLQGHARLFPKLGAERAKPYYRAFWGAVALARWQDCDALHIMLHGGGRSLIRRARSEGALIVGEPVNVHPEVQNAILEAERTRVKLVRHQHLSPAQRQILEEVELSDYLVVASDFIKRSYAEKGYPADRIKVLRYGVDLGRFSTEAGDRAAPERFKVICVAGINARKGIIDLLDAWRELKLEAADLLLIGRVSPEMEPVLRRYAGSFRHVPHVPHHELPRYLSESTVFVLPSLEDGFGLVCTEAMACGVPVIATSNTGAAELIRGGVNGYVVPIRAPHLIAEKLYALHADREKARAMGIEAAKTARQLYDWRGYAERLLEWYGTLLTRKPHLDSQQADGNRV